MQDEQIYLKSPLPHAYVQDCYRKRQLKMTWVLMVLRIGVVDKDAILLWLEGLVDKESPHGSQVTTEYVPAENCSLKTVLRILDRHGLAGDELTSRCLFYVNRPKPPHRAQRAEEGSNEGLIWGLCLIRIPLFMVRRPTIACLQALAEPGIPHKSLG